MKKRIWAVTNYGVSLYPLCLLGEVLYYDCHKLFGRNFASGIGEFKNGVNRWAIFPGSREQVARPVVVRILKDKKWVKKVIAKNYSACERLLLQADKTFKADLTEKTDKELLALYQAYNEKYRTAYLYGWLANAAEAENNYFSRILEQTLAEKLKSAGRPEKMGEYFSALTTLAEDSERDRERRDFLKLLAGAKKNKYLKKLFFRHWQKYCWLQYDYDGPALTLEYFTAEARALLAAKVNPLAELKKISAERRKLLSKQKRLVKELKLTPKEAYLFWLGRQFAFIKNYRKDVLYLSYYRHDFLLKEIGRRRGLSVKQIKHILPGEMPICLLKNRCDVGGLNERIKYSILEYPPTGMKVSISAAARSIVKEKIASPEAKPNAGGLFGQTAFAGKAKGRVRIVNVPEEMKNFKKGEILVSEKTNPNLLLAMKKAAAIVTDAGGLTCHAAIVSRELKIPCVVGTKFATKILKNGDRVMVDADKGAVNLLK
ncbi:MAG: hypothetical protein A2663_04815 [Candidatus Buchananbacteria bacterium RIFCSPHIGHO2_01_FULL_46_12]|uniref:PEP-utilising enzyme mobile domain-containing protein n=1 Tax=Candidatus Buchananbacteria bacterium RIFCSPHIGHO2_01_FULL_46_12 TaxID=1797536 RepID=A0A1G1YB93_9BACT|nr:MAG: hypothetical protein A2663_04815 [Candidatus Buchananbacteria bacterium RIFCSPHIGHO2_01_FULL_46_12]